MGRVPHLDDVRATYDAVAEPYAEQFADELAGKPLDRSLIDAFAATVHATGDPAPVADLGCGPGHTTRYLADLGLSALGVDLSPGMVRSARARYIGDERLHLDTWFDRPVSIDGYLFDPDRVQAVLTDVGFEVQAWLRRRPYAGIEVPTERAYLLGRRSVAG